jgi:Ca2+-binding RTX toxin-like protein
VLRLDLPSTSTIITEPTVQNGATCTGTTHVECDLGAVPAGASTGTELTLRFGAAGAVVLDASATTDRDADESDNSAAESVLVKAPASRAPTTVHPKAPTRHSVHGTSRADLLIGTAGADTIHGGAGKDRINGRGGNDRLWGDAGNDTITGGTGSDHIYGGLGNDRIYAFDRSRDVIDCGPGRDVVSADRHDTVRKNCEVVKRR